MLQLVHYYQNNNKIDFEEILEILKKIYLYSEELVNVISEIVKQDNLEAVNERKILESVMGSVEYIDHFYPTSNKIYSQIKNPEDYISLGSIINSLIFPSFNSTTFVFAKGEISSMPSSL